LVKSLIYPCGISGESFFARFHKVLELGIVDTGADTSPPVKVPDRSITSEAFQYNTDLSLSSELAAGNAFYVPYELLGLLVSGLSLLVLIGYPLNNVLAYFLVRYFTACEE
jgi:hypothetical protein